MKNPSMFLMLLLATAMPEMQDSPRGSKHKPGMDARGVASPGQDAKEIALEIDHLAAARQIKPAA